MLTHKYSTTYYALTSLVGQNNAAGKVDWRKPWQINNSDKFLVEKFGKSLPANKNITLLDERVRLINTTQCC